MRIRQSISFVIVLVLWIAFAGCKGSGSVSTPKYVPTGQINFRGDGYEETVKDSIKQAVPIGTSVADAKRVLEESGCECSMETKNGKDRLHCTHSRKHGVWVTMVWQINCSIEDGKVADLESREYGIGP